jgi:HAMP domain-containing protein
MAHWTQTPEGKKKLARAMRKAHRTRRAAARRQPPAEIAALAKLGAKARIEHLEAEIRRLRQFLKA